MMRWVRIEDVGDTEFLLDEQMDKFRSLEDNERVIQAGGRPATRSRCCSDHQSVALDRLVHPGGELPGNDAHADRGVDLREDRPPARAEGERGISEREFEAVLLRGDLVPEGQDIIGVRRTASAS
jgi:hypothetical protein